MQQVIKNTRLLRISRVREFARNFRWHPATSGLPVSAAGWPRPRVILRRTSWFNLAPSHCSSFARWLRKKESRACVPYTRRRTIVHRYDKRTYFFWTIVDDSPSSIARSHELKTFLLHLTPSSANVRDIFARIWTGESKEGVGIFPADDGPSSDGEGFWWKPTDPERGEYIDCVSFLVSSQRTHSAHSSVCVLPVTFINRVSSPDSLSFIRPLVGSSRRFFFPLSPLSSRGRKAKRKKPSYDGRNASAKCVCQ